MDKFLKFIGGVVVLFVVILFDAFVLTKLWQWFIVSLFNLPLLNLAYAYGLSLLINYLKGFKKQSETNEKIWELFFIAFARSGIALLAGYIVYQFV